MIIVLKFTYRYLLALLACNCLTGDGEGSALEYESMEYESLKSESNNNNVCNVYMEHYIHVLSCSVAHA